MVCIERMSVICLYLVILFLAGLVSGFNTPLSTGTAYMGVDTLMMCSVVYKKSFLASALF